MIIANRVVEWLSSGKRRVFRCGCAMLCAVFLGPLPASGADTSAVRFPELKLGLMPLIVLGDVNEDGRVDKADRALVAAMVASNAGAIPAAAT